MTSTEAEEPKTGGDGGPMPPDFLAVFADHPRIREKPLLTALGAYGVALLLALVVFLLQLWVLELTLYLILGVVMLMVRQSVMAVQPPEAAPTVKMMNVPEYVWPTILLWLITFPMHLIPIAAMRRRLAKAGHFDKPAEAAAATDTPPTGEP